MAPTGDTTDPKDGIFSGMTFWLSLKVPLRSILINRVKANGGTVVKQEKDAQMLIAERKDGIPGSYASAFLLDSMHEGRLLDKAAYLKEPPPAGVTKPKATRTAFTRDDDAELIAWVLPHVEAGGKDKGNELYQELENRNSRHTAQSWRDRYVKKYADQSIEKLRAMASHFQKGPAQPAQNLPPMPLPALPGRAAPASQSVQGTPPSASRQRPGAKRARFTEEEDTTLLDALRLEPNPEKITEWFKQFAQKYPTHSWEAWYNHYKKIIVPRLRDTEPSEAQPSPTQGEEPSPAERRGQAPSTPAKAPAPSRAATRNEAPSTPANPPPLQEQVPEDHEEQDEETGDPELEAAERETFFDNLKIFMNAQGKLNNTMDFEPTIERQVVDLYQLYTIVDELDTDLDPSEFSGREWAEIATLLGLDCSNGKSIPLKTSKIWDVYLKDFYQSLEPDVEEEEEDDDDPVQDDLSPSGPMFGRKRSLESEPELPSKRRQRSRDDEIAATPVSNVRRGEKPKTSPSLAAGAPTPSLPSRHRPTNEDDEDNLTPSQQLHDEEAELTPIPIQLDGPSSRRRSNRSRPVPESPTAAREDSEPPAQDDGVAELASQCERFQALGYSAADVKTALKATTLDIGLAGYVMEHYLRQKKNLPTNMEGVWTERDDDGLRFVDGLPSRMGAGNGEEATTRRRRKTEWERLVEKHTQDRIETRREYLELASEVVGH